MGGKVKTSFRFFFFYLFFFCFYLFFFFFVNLILFQFYFFTANLWRNRLQSATKIATKIESINATKIESINATKIATKIATNIATKNATKNATKIASVTKLKLHCVLFFGCCFCCFNLLLFQFFFWLQICLDPNLVCLSQCNI